MKRRDFLKSLAMPAVACRLYAQRTRGLPPLTIRDVKVIATSAGGRYQWVFLKIITSEPGLYGLGSASNVNSAFAVIAAKRGEETRAHGRKSFFYSTGLAEGPLVDR